MYRAIRHSPHPRYIDADHAEHIRTAASGVALHSGPIDNISFGALSVERDEVTTMAVAIARVFVVPAQCQARHGECLNNVYDPKEIIPPEGRLCIDCLFLDAMSALPRLPSPESDAHIKVRLCFLMGYDLHSEVLRVARHTGGRLFCITDGRRTTNSFD